MKKRKYAVNELAGLLSGQNNLSFIETQWMEIQWKALYDEGRFGDAIDSSLKLLCDRGRHTPYDTVITTARCGIYVHDARAIVEELDPLPTGKLWKELDDPKCFPKLGRLILGVVGLLICAALVWGVFRLPFFDTLQFTGDHETILFVILGIIAIIAGIRYNSWWVGGGTILVELAIAAYVLERYPLGGILRVLLAILIIFVAFSYPIDTVRKNISSLNPKTRRQVRQAIREYEMLIDVMNQKLRNSEQYVNARLSELSAPEVSEETKAKELDRYQAMEEGLDFFRQLTEIFEGLLSKRKKGKK